MNDGSDFKEQFARDLEGLSALATKLAKVVRSKGADGPPAAAARLMIASDKAKASLEKHAAYLLNA
jgi:hypothetical protein